MNAAELVPSIHELFGQYPRASRLAPEQVAALLWILCYVASGEPPEVFEVAAALEVLDIETGREAA
jgi:hypothetical protein